jgi:hypothetical protein
MALALDHLRFIEHHALSTGSLERIGKTKSKNLVSKVDWESKTLIPGDHSIDILSKKYLRLHKSSQPKT